MRTRQSAERGLLIERHGAATIAYALREDNGALIYAQRFVGMIVGVYAYGYYLLARPPSGIAA